MKLPLHRIGKLVEFIPFNFILLVNFIRRHSMLLCTKMIFNSFSFAVNQKDPILFIRVHFKISFVSCFSALCRFIWEHRTMDKQQFPFKRVYQLLIIFSAARCRHLARGFGHILKALRSSVELSGFSVKLVTRSRLRENE